MHVEVLLDEHLAQLEVESHNKHVWFICRVVVWLEKAYPKGQIRQLEVDEHVVLAIHILPDKLYPYRHVRHDEVLLAEHVAHGISHYYWHDKLWFRK